MNQTVVDEILAKLSPENRARLFRALNGCSEKRREEKILKAFEEFERSVAQAWELLAKSERMLKGA